MRKNRENQNETISVEVMKEEGFPQNQEKVGNMKHGKRTSRRLQTKGWTKIRNMLKTKNGTNDKSDVT
jgi:hypothetical protein